MAEKNNIALDAVESAKKSATFAAYLISAGFEIMSQAQLASVKDGNFRTVRFQMTRENNCQAFDFPGVVKDFTEAIPVKDRQVSDVYVTVDKAQCVALCSVTALFGFEEERHDEISRLTKEFISAGFTIRSFASFQKLYGEGIQRHKVVLHKHPEEPYSYDGFVRCLEESIGKGKKEISDIWIDLNGDAMCTCYCSYRTPLELPIRP